MSSARNSASDLTAQTVSHCEHQPAIDGLRNSLNAALRGKSEVVEFVLACLLARGHLLFDDLPGLGKTTMAKALAQAIDGRFSSRTVHSGPASKRRDRFSISSMKGPANLNSSRGRSFPTYFWPTKLIVLTPRTQSALFEAMAERQVTYDNQSRKLPDSFFVIATQNPVESHGAYPLPEAQLDRFAMKLRIGYPDRLSELEMLASNIGSSDSEADTSCPVVNTEQLRDLQNHVANVAMSKPVQGVLARPCSRHKRTPGDHIGSEPAWGLDLAKSRPSPSALTTARLRYPRRHPRRGRRSAGRAPHRRLLIHPQESWMKC